MIGRLTGRSGGRGALLAGVMAAALWSVPASAQRQHIDLPAGDAAQSVQALARQSGLQVLAPNRDLKGVRTKAVSGDLDPVDALRRMLADTGLSVTQTGVNTVTITRGDNQAEATVAGEPVETSEEIVVTGSRIRRPGYDTLEAAIVTDGEQARKRGYTNVIQALDDTPGFSSSGVNQTGSDQGTLNAGQNFADFFGLGSQRTLTLVNSRRFVSSNSVSATGNAASPGQQVDLNLIPIGLIDRIETVAIGGAPIYGSDAIAGTVNVILKDKLQGVQLDAQYGITERGDARSYSFRGSAGMNFADDRGNIAVAGEYNRQFGIVQSTRTGDRFQLPNLLGTPSANLVTRDFTVSGLTEGGLPFNPNTFDNIRDAAGTALQFDRGGSLVAFIPGDPLNGLAAAGFSDGGDGVRFADHRSLLSPTERIIGTALAHFDITSAIRVFGEFSYARSTGNELSEIAAFASPFLSGTVIPVSIDNPYLSPAARATLVANGVGTSFPLARNFSDLLDRGGLTRNRIELFRGVAGVSGDFTLFGEKAGWDVSFNYGRSRGVADQKYIDNDRFLLAIDTIRDGSGNVVCRSGGSCVPFNLFGEDAFSDAAAAYVINPARAVSLNTQQVATANLNGAFPFRISTQPIEFNLGVEYRRESGSFRPDATLQAGTSLLGLSLASPFIPSSGNFHTKEVYGELSVPLVSPDQDISFIKSVSIEGAARYVDNSIAGGDLTWSAGGRFAPRLPGVLDGLLFRGVYTRSIRAPAVTELFSGASSTRGSISDPCDARFYQEGDNPAVRAQNCAAALQAFGKSPAAFMSTTFGLSPIGTISGNRDLENEKARSWSAGVVFQPPALPGLRLAADWSEIRLEGGIQSLGINALLAACYDSPNYPNLQACDSFRRLGTNEVGPGSANPVRVAGDVANGYTSGFVNTSLLEFAGLIITGEYTLPLQRLLGSSGDAGNIQLSAKFFHNAKYDVQNTPGGPITSSVGAAGLPRWAGQLNFGYANREFDFLLQSLYTGPVKNQLLSTSADIPDEFNKIGSYWRFNTTIGFNVDERFRLQFVVNNLFDRKPSNAEIFSGAFGTYDLIGRRYLATATARF